MDLSFQSKMAVFADLNNSDLMSQYIGCKFDVVWSDLKHSGTHEYTGEQVDFTAPKTFSTVDFRYCAMMRGVMEESYFREVCVSLPGWESRIGGGAIVSLRLTFVRVVSDVCFPNSSSFGLDGPLSAIDYRYYVEGLNHLSSFRLSVEQRSTAAIFKARERSVHVRTPISSQGRCLANWVRI